MTKSLKKFRVLLIDDNEYVRFSLKIALEGEQGFEVFEASTPQDALILYKQHLPNVVLMDLLLRGANGIDVSRDLLEAHPKARIIILTAHQKEDDIFTAVELGVFGYIIKDTSVNELACYILSCHEGKRVFSPIVQKIINRGQKSEKYTI